MHLDTLIIYFAMIIKQEGSNTPLQQLQKLLGGPQKCLGRKHQLVVNQKSSAITDPSIWFVLKQESVNMSLRCKSQ